MAAALKKVAQEPRRIYVAEANVKPAESLMRQFRVLVPSEHTIEDLQSPDYWIHNSRRFVKDTLLWCFHEKGEWSALLWVYDRSDTYARTKVMQYTDYRGVDVANPDPENYMTKHVPNVGWSVIFKPNKSLLATALQSEMEAQQFIERMVAGK